MVGVSVIIPFYEGEKWLEEAVASVINQTYDDYEIIVVNDGSKEDLSGFIDKYGSLVKLFNKENGGPSTARNLGIEMASGKYIAFLDSDDKWLDNKLELQVKAMEQYNCIWSYCSYKTFGLGDSKEYVMVEGNVPIMKRYNTPYIATPGVMILRKYLVDNPKCRFNPDLRYGQDSYFWLMINADYPVLVIPDILFEVRMRGTNASKRARVQLQARSNVWKCRKDNRDQLIDRFNISFAYRLASELCIFGNKVVTLFEKQITNAIIIEYISRGLFLIPWLLFRLDGMIKKNYD